MLMKPFGTVILGANIIYIKIIFKVILIILSLCSEYKIIL